MAQIHAQVGHRLEVGELGDSTFVVGLTIGTARNGRACGMEHAIGVSGCNKRSGKQRVLVPRMVVGVESERS